MNCFQCGAEMQDLEFSRSDFENRNNVEDLKFSFRSRNKSYECEACDIGFLIMMYNIWHVENNLTLKNGKWKKLC